MSFFFQFDSSDTHFAMDIPDVVESVVEQLVRATIKTDMEQLAWVDIPFGVDPRTVQEWFKDFNPMMREEIIENRALAAIRAHPLGEKGSVIGRVTESHAGTVIMETTFGGRRVVDMLVGDQLPRIC